MSFWEVAALCGAPFLLGFGFGWEIHKAKSLRETEEARQKLEEQLGENKKAIEDHYAGKSSDDIINDYLNKGG